MKYVREICVPQQIISWSCRTKGSGIAVPELPGAFGLETKHLVTILNSCSSFLSFLQESSKGGIVDQVEQHVIRANGIVGQLRLVFRSGKHTNGSSINNEMVFLQHLPCYIGISYDLFRIRGSASRYFHPLHTELVEHKGDRVRRTAGTQYQSLAVVGF